MPFTLGLGLGLMPSNLRGVPVGLRCEHPLPADWASLDVTPPSTATSCLFLQLP